MADPMKTIMVLTPIAVGYFSRVLEGVGAYALQVKPWIFEFETHFDAALPTLQESRHDGMIVDLTLLEWLQPLLDLNVPFVTIAPRKDINLPRVGVDEYAIGRMAAEYFLDRGFEQFSFCGYEQEPFSEERRRGYCQTVEQAGYEVEVLYTPYSFTVVGHVQESIIDWLQRRPAPTALFVCHDRLGLRINQICRRIQLKVPDHIAILGVDNSHLDCEFTHPPLSSIDTGPERVGYEAAALLERMMAGEPPPNQPILLSPVEVVTRQSTDVLAVSNPELAAAIRFIRDNANQPIDVSDILEQIPISRRTLEMECRRVLGRSPFEEIRRSHVERARQLLVRTDLQMPEVARRSGLVHASKLSSVFRREVGLTPTEYRRRYRLQAEQPE